MDNKRYDSVLIIGFGTALTIGLFITNLIFNYESMKKNEQNWEQYQYEQQQNQVSAGAITGEAQKLFIVSGTSVADVKEKVQKKVEKVTYKKVKMLSKHSITNWNSGSNRNTNMKIAGKIINGKGNKGLIMNSGDEFSWIETIGQTTSEKGFLSAGIIVNGKHAEGLGGGVCQVASTLNSAIVKAGLKTNSQKHSVSVGYLSSKDYEATVSYDSKKDLKFKNTFKFPIRINVTTNGGKVTAKVYKMKQEIHYE